MIQKTVLIIDDEQGFVEALQDALIFEGNRVLTARSGSEALAILKSNHIDLATVDIMMPPGESLERFVDSHHTGVYLCETIKKNYPKTGILCISVVTDQDTIKSIRTLGVQFLKKGEVPLRTLLAMIRSKLTGIAYSTDPNFDKQGYRK